MVPILKKNTTQLQDVYYNPSQPGSFGGIQALSRATGLPAKKIIPWLQEQETYTLHKSVRRRYPRDRIIVDNIDTQWESDLVDLRGISRLNQQYQFLLTVIDVLSKYAWAVPLKDKTGDSIIRAFQHIFKKDRRQPRYLRTDKGTEFVNQKFQKFLKEKGIHFFTSNNETKAAVVERFNRTLKNRMWKYFSANNTRRYIDVLPQLLESYNHTWHRSIKRTPAEVNEDNAQDVWQTLYGKLVKKKEQYKFKIGDHVRLSKLKRTFEKGYLPNWTTELFRISKRMKGPKYKVTDLQGEEIQGTFLEPELQKVTVTKDKLYRVEKVLKRRGKGKRGKVLVKWEGYPDKFNSWIAASDLSWPLKTK